MCPCWTASPEPCVTARPLWTGNCPMRCTSSKTITCGAKAGIEIIACGTCLNFFELGDSLEVGRVTDMLEIASRLADAGSIVCP